MTAAQIHLAACLWNRGADSLSISRLVRGCTEPLVYQHMDDIKAEAAELRRSSSMIASLLSRIGLRRPVIPVAPSRREIDAARADLAAHRANHRTTRHARAHLRSLIIQSLKAHVAARKGA